MPQLPNSLRLLLVTLASSVASASPADSSIFARQSTCAAKNLNSCPDSLPSNFCCPEGSSCVALAGDTTVLCCPNSQSCKKIQPITCNIREQDPDNNPTAPIKTSVFDVDLETCGDGTCCPFGYSCTGDNRCQQKEDQSESPKGSKSTPSSSVGSGTTTEPSATGTGTNSPDASATTTPATSAPTSSETSDPGSSSSHSGSNPKTTSIIGGVIGGCLVLLLIIVIAFLYIRRSRRKSPLSEKSSHARSNTSGSSSFGNFISEPIMQPNSYRTDFMLKPPSLGAPSSVSSPPTRHPRVSIPNPFNSPNPSARSRDSYASHDAGDHQPRAGHVVNARLAPIRAMKASSSYSRRPSTQNVDRELSSESINVFADPSEVDRNDRHRRDDDDARNRYTLATTFTELMDEADLSEVHRGRPYVPGTTPRI